MNNVVELKCKSKYKYEIVVRYDDELGKIYCTDAYISDAMPSHVILLDACLADTKSKSTKHTKLKYIFSLDKAKTMYIYEPYVVSINEVK